MGRVHPLCIWGAYAERLRERLRFTVAGGTSSPTMPSNAPRSVHARRTASTSPLARAARMVRIATSRSSVGTCRESVDRPAIAGLRIVDGSIRSLVSPLISTEKLFSHAFSLQVS